MLDRLDMNIDPRAYVGDLSVAQRQMVEIAKALSYESKLIIMDEPTATLTEKEVLKIFEIVKSPAIPGGGDHLHLPPPGGGLRAVRPDHGAAGRAQDRHQGHRGRRTRTRSSR